MSSLAQPSSLTAPSEIRTGAWYGDAPLTLSFPSEWNVEVRWPHTPRRSTDSEISACLARPTGKPRIAELCHGKLRPLVIVDDLNRPTPASRVLPFLLREFQQAGIAPSAVRILLSTGTHGRPSPAVAARKVGADVAARCEVIVHDPSKDCFAIGKTSFGTPVSVNKAVLSSDFVIGIGGVYPNGTAGFGGGSKLALGVLAFGSIVHLHYRHQSAGWGKSKPGQPFRRDVDEIARMIHLNFSVVLHVDAEREVVRVACGDPFLIQEPEAEFARRTYTVPAPGDADVVISNAYPSDVSVTSVHMKGLAPVLHCAPGASRIVIASCPEGFGHHGVFPVVNRPKFYRAMHLARRLSITEPREILQRVARRARAWRTPQNPSAQPVPKRNPIWMYRPGRHNVDLPFHSAEFQVTGSWTDILQAVAREQSSARPLKAVLYPCVPMQMLEGTTAHITGGE